MPAPGARRPAPPAPPWRSCACYAAGDAPARTVGPRALPPAARVRPPERQRPQRGAGARAHRARRPHAAGEIGAGGTLPIAAVFPTIGRYAVSGLQSLQGARLAVEDINRAGGVNGRLLRLAEYRTGSYFVDAQHAAALAARDGALAIVGANSSELSAGGRRGGRGERRPAGHERLDRRRPHLRPADRPHAAVRVPHVRLGRGDGCACSPSFAVGRLGARRAAVLYEVGRNYSAAARAHASPPASRDRAAGREVAEFHYLALETDFRPQLRRDPGVPPRRRSSCPARSPTRRSSPHRRATVGLRTRRSSAATRGRARCSSSAARRPATPTTSSCARRAPEFDRRYEARRGGASAPGCRAVLAYDAVHVIAARARARSGRSSAEAPREPGSPRRAGGCATRRAAATWTAATGRSASTRAATAARASRSTRSRRRRRGPRARARAAGWASRERRLPAAARPEPARQGRRSRSPSCSSPAWPRCCSCSCRCSASSASACSSRTSGCSRRCAATTSASFIYDLLSRNRESLAVHLADLAAQEGLLWARVRGGRPRPRGHRRPRP